MTSSLKTSWLASEKSLNWWTSGLAVQSTVSETLTSMSAKQDVIPFSFSPGHSQILPSLQRVLFVCVQKERVWAAPALRCLQPRPSDARCLRGRPAELTTQFTRAHSIHNRALPGARPSWPSYLPGNAVSFRELLEKFAVAVAKRVTARATVINIVIWHNSKSRHLLVSYSRMSHISWHPAKLWITILEYRLACPCRLRFLCWNRGSIRFSRLLPSSQWCSIRMQSRFK